MRFPAVESLKEILASAVRERDQSVAEAESCPSPGASSEMGTGDAWGGGLGHPRGRRGAQPGLSLQTVTPAASMAPWSFAGRIPTPGSG